MVQVSSAQVIRVGANGEPVIDTADDDRVNDDGVRTISIGPYRISLAPSGKMPKPRDATERVVDISLTTDILMFTCFFLSLLVLLYYISTFLTGADATINGFMRFRWIRMYTDALYQGLFKPMGTYLDGLFQPLGMYMSISLQSASLMAGIFPPSPPPPPPPSWFDGLSTAERPPDGSVSPLSPSPPVYTFPPVMHFHDDGRAFAKQEWAPDKKNWVTARIPPHQQFSFDQEQLKRAGTKIVITPAPKVKPPKPTPPPPPSPPKPLEAPRTPPLPAPSPPPVGSIQPPPLPPPRTPQRKNKKKGQRSPVAPPPSPPVGRTRTCSNQCSSCSASGAEPVASRALPTFVTARADVSVKKGAVRTNESPPSNEPPKESIVPRIPTGGFAAAKGGGGVKRLHVRVPGS